MGVSASPFSVDLLRDDAGREDVYRILPNALSNVDVGKIRQKYKWMNEANPAGESLTYLLLDIEQQKNVGVLSTCHRAFCLNKQKVDAGTLIDFAVDKSYRSLGPAMQLLNQSVNQSKQTLSFLYGFPNRKATPVFKRAGALPIGELDGLVRVLRFNKYFSSRLPPFLSPLFSFIANGLLSIVDGYLGLLASRNARGVLLGNESAVLDTLWEQSQYNNVLMSERSAETISWRTLNGSEYACLQTFVVLEGRASDKPLGYVLYWLKDDSIQVLDFFMLRPEKTLVKTIWRLFLKHAQTLRKDNVFLEFMGPDEVTAGLKTVGFVKRESVTVMVFADHLSEANDVSWYLTGFDRDT